MKAKDLKPGMVVAVGTPASVHHATFYPIMAVVVEVGKVCLRWSRVQGATYSKTSRGITKVAVGKCNLNGIDKASEWVPEIIPLSHVLMLWEDAVKLTEKKKNEWMEKEQKMKKEYSDFSLRLGKASERISSLVLNEIWLGGDPTLGKVIMPLTLLESLLEKLEKENEDQ